MFKNLDNSNNLYKNFNNERKNKIISNDNNDNNDYNDELLNRILNNRSISSLDDSNTIN